MAWHTHKKLTLGQSSNWSNPVNSYLTTWLLNITDEVWLRLINLRERLSVGWYTTTMYNILFLNCNLCSTKNDLLYLSEGSLELKQAICCLIVFVVHDQTSQDTNMSSPSAEYVFFFCLYPVWKQPETSTPGSGLDHSKSLFFWWYITFLRIFQYLGVRKCLSTSHSSLPCFTYFDQALICMKSQVEPCLKKTISKRTNWSPSQPHHIEES